MNNQTIDADLGEALVDDEHNIAREIALVIRRQIEKTYPPDKRPARRDAHPKAHGCVRAEFRIKDELFPKLAHGIFVPGKSYRAWIRFSNGSGNPKRGDSKGDSRGMAIKLLDVPGDKLLPDERHATTHDFLMINHPTFIVDDPRRYLRLIKLSNSENLLLRLAAPFAIGLRGALIARAITTSTIASPLEARYWSTTAYRLGSGEHKTAVKFSARPWLAPTAHMPRNPAPNFLRHAMMQQLATGEVRFDFLVQPRTSPTMSVENSMIEWNEARAPFYKVATITIPQQKFSSPAQDEFGDNLSFTPWHALPAHRPLGRVNRVRRVVYEELSKLRHELNHAPRSEPSGEEVFE
jgi:hypothetical protein